MPPAPLPITEAQRLAALYSYDVLDTACEASFDSLTRLAARLTGCPISLVSLVDADRQWFKSHAGLEAPETPRDVSFCAHAIITPNQPLIVGDAVLDARFLDNPLVTGNMSLRFYAGVPLVTPEGHALGTLCVIDTTPRSLPPEALETLTALAQSVMTTLELRRAMTGMRALALTDVLTGLPNRQAFLVALSQAIARQRHTATPFSVLYLDLDGFKRVNDERGHAAGDQVLIELAGLLRRHLRPADCAARLGGDEFAAVLENVTPEETGVIAERLREAIAAGMAAAGWPVTASIGAVAFRDPPPDESAALAQADQHMYAAKSAGKNRVAIRS